VTDPVIIGRARLFLGDCRDVLPTLGRVDLVATDPPYGIGKAAWDSEVQLDWFGMALALLPPSGAAYVFGDVLTLSRFQVHWEDRGVEWKSRIAWVYEDGPRNAKAWTRKHEDCLFYAGPEHQLKTPREASTHCDPRWGDDRLVGDVWKRARVLGSYDEREDHPTQKPLAVMLLPVRASCQEGGVILDPFMGSGTTGVAAVQMGRDFIGIEKDPAYFEIACKRIEDAQRQFNMFEAAE
jgi:site-specific DNA-methyltransferase (adenine-specific)